MDRTDHWRAGHTIGQARHAWRGAGNAPRECAQSEQSSGGCVARHRWRGDLARRRGQRDERHGVLNGRERG
eukprot:5171307-Pleurochrysis_carterae.AAC.1